MHALAPPMTDSGRPVVVVVGGGVTGLSAAYAVHRARPDVTVRLFEARDHVGGNIVTERIDGFVIDAGPDSFLRTKPEAVALCRELGLESELIPTRAEARHVFAAHQGKLVPLPGGMALAVPTRLGPLIETPLLSLWGKLRLLAEPFIGRGGGDADESIESFFSRRVGKEAARVLAAPLLAGIYAGDFRELSIRSTFPQLVELERKHGSLLRGFLALELARSAGEPKRISLGDVYRWLRRRGEAQAASPFLSLRSGMGTLIDALVGALPEGAVRTSSPVTSVRREGVRFRVELGPESFVADRVILASPAHSTARFLGEEGLAREFGGIPTVSTATVFFALDRAKVRHSLAGFGFIVPEGEAKILAGTWVSSKWDDRAPADGALVRAFVGGARDPERVASSTDEELVALARSELERFMGPLGEARFSRVFRYERANPQPILGHAERLARLDALVRAVPGLAFCGASYDGVGIPDCVRQARRAADTVLTGLPGAVVRAGAE
ncbi:MAG TPA: protoporphyrinogen oxidase [Polyangiaceae bacterium]|nr:protoporphyrinogen oxidase [Polyangiaceae bacterium]